MDPKNYIPTKRDELNPVSKLLYLILYFIVHFIIEVYDRCSSWWKRNRSKYTIEDLIVEKKSFKRLPTHLALMVNYDDYKYMGMDDICRLVSWCVMLEFEYVTIYDNNGILANERSLIERKINQYCNQKKSNLKQKSDEDGSKLPYFTVTVDNHTTKIRLLSSTDGREKLVNIIIELAKAKLNESDTKKETHPFELTKLLRKDFQFPDPEFAIICNYSYSVYGYPPWQIRYTEIAKFPDVDNVTVENFHKMLCVYNKIEARFGQ